MAGLVPAAVPTIHFIGVSTAQSAIMTVFPRWAESLGLGACAINGIDLPLHAPDAAYRETVKFIHDDPRSLGALVTAHKIDLLHAARDLVDELDGHAAALGELSCLSKRRGKLVGHAKDPISARLALDAIVPEGHWSGGDAFLMGAGGAATAITWNLMQPERGGGAGRRGGGGGGPGGRGGGGPARPNPSTVGPRAGGGGPRHIVVSDVDPGRLDALRRFHASLDSDVPVEYVLASSSGRNDAILHALAERSLVVNATGLGKDCPGSPLGAAARFPRGSIAWELNYRGDLLFLDRAEAQAGQSGLATFDGWNYFLHGWTQVIAEVFAVEIASAGPSFDALSTLAGGPPRARTHAA